MTSIALNISFDNVRTDHVINKLTPAGIWYPCSSISCDSVRTVPVATGSNLEKITAN